MDNAINLDKIVFLLRELYKKDIDRRWMFNLINISHFEFKEHWNKTLSPTWTVFNLTIHVGHSIFIDNFKHIESIKNIVKDDFNKLSEVYIDDLEILPDYQKLQIINSEIHPVLTEWEDINISQATLLNHLKTGNNSLDFQNIGNTARTIMLKLASIVFKTEIHSPQDKTIDVGPGKFKNQLQCYIRSKLSGQKNKELRDFCEAAITTVEKTIDLANTITHKLEARRSIAELCVSGVITSISIIKYIEEQN